MLRVVLASVLGSLFLLQAVLARPPRPVLQPSAPPALGDLILVTEDFAADVEGCDAVSVFDANTGDALHRGETRVSPGRLAAAADLSLVVATQNNTELLEDESWQAFLYVLQLDPSDYRTGSTAALLGGDFATFGGIAMLPDGRTILVATSNKERDDQWLVNHRPFQVRKYRVPANIRDRGSIGPALERFTVDGVAVEILISPDGSRAHVLTGSSTIYTLEVATLTQAAIQFPVAPIEGLRTDFHVQPLNYMHATLSGDGRYMVTNRGRSPSLGVADLYERRAWTVAQAPDVEFSGGVAFNRGALNFGLLAVHALDKVILYRFGPDGPLIELGRTDLDPPYVADRMNTAPVAAIAWNGRGNRVIAATNDGLSEFAVFDVLDEGATLSRRASLLACDEGNNLPNDILTANGSLPTPTPTSTDPPSTISPRPTETPPTVPTATTTPTLTASPTHTPTVTAPAGSTAKPAVLCLPIAVKEPACVAPTGHADVALVIDASTSMLERTLAGRSKLAAAFDAADTFLGELDMPRDQVAIVSFNAAAETVQTLTGDRWSCLESLGRITVQQQSRIDLGIRTAHDELASERRRATNQPVIVVLTDGRSNPIGPEAAVEHARLAKLAGIALFSVGLGQDLDVWALEAIASKPTYFYRAPDAEDLAEIYQEIAHTVPCPADSYWPYRP